MLKERESLVRNEYDKVLTAKLAGRFVSGCFTKLSTHFYLLLVSRTI